MQSDAPPPAYYVPWAPPSPAERPRLPPPPSRWQERPRYGLIGAGAGVVGGLWMINLIAAASIPAVDTGATVWPLYLPIVGPFLEMGEVQGFSLALLAINGVLQVGGVAMIVAGAVARKKIALYGDRLLLVPTARPGGGGVAAALRF